MTKGRKGARINAAYLRPSARKVNFKKCEVCGKALHSENKVGLCSKDYSREYSLNWQHQGFYKKWKEEKRKNELRIIK